MTPKKTLFWLCALIFLTLPAKAFVCACCAEPGQYSISTRKLGGHELEVLRRLRFASANLYTNAAYPDNIKGLAPLGESYSVSGLFQNRGWRLNFTDDSNRAGMLELPLPGSMVEYMADIDDNVEDREPTLYKEWRFKFNVRAGNGIFQSGLRRQPGTEYFLVLQGRGNSCTDAGDFQKWRLEVTGRKASYAFYGKLQAAS